MFIYWNVKTNTTTDMQKLADHVYPKGGQNVNKHLPHEGYVFTYIMPAVCRFYYGISLYCTYVLILGQVN